MVDAAPDVLRAHVDLPDRAVVVEEVVPGMPAETMGLVLFDVITHVDGQPVGTAEDVRRALNREGAPDTVTITVLRRGARHELSAKRPAPR
jgi:S1-C subfamily serine protease